MEHFFGDAGVDELLALCDGCRSCATCHLLGGFDLTSGIIGLYCIPVLIDLVASRAGHLNVIEEKGGFRFIEALKITFASKVNVLRSSVIGTAIGMLPGAGGSIAGLISYSEARRNSKHPERFGTGEPDGVIATESSNNATVGGGFIPTLVLGIPGTPPDAIILGGLLVRGLKIGPSLFNEQGGIVYTFMYGLLFATVLMLPVGLLLGRYAYRTMVRVPKSLLVPAVAFLTVVGSFAIHSNPDDVIIIMVALGVMAWVLQRFGFTPSPIVLGLVLGQIAEQGFVQAYLMGSAQNATLQMFFGRPISMAIIAFAVLTLSYPLIDAVWRKAKTKDVAVERTDMVVESASHDEVAVQYRDAPTIVWSVILAALSFAALRADQGHVRHGCRVPRHGLGHTRLAVASPHRPPDSFACAASQGRRETGRRKDQCSVALL